MLRTTCLLALAATACAGSSSTTSPSDASTADAVSSCAACQASDLCVVTQSGDNCATGPDDAGTCPAGMTPNGPTCCVSTAITCAPAPGACNGTATCACAGQLCPCANACVVGDPRTVTCNCSTPHK